MALNKEYKKKLESNIWKFRLFEMFSGVWFFIPILVLFWQDNGLSYTQIMVLQSVYAMAIVFLEVPTGYFADLYGRKKSLVIGAIGLFFAVLIYSFSSTYLQFFAAEMFYALSLSMISGANSALVYDSLVTLKKESQYKRVWGDIVFYGLIATAVGNVTGGFIGNYNFRWAFYAMIPFMLALIIISLTLTEPRKHKKIVKKGYMLKILKTVKKTVFHNIKLRWLLFYAAIIIGFNQAGLWLIQPYLLLSGVDVLYFGIIFASFQLVAAVSSKYSHKVEESLGQKNSLIFLLVLLTLSYFLMSAFVFWFSFIFIYMRQFIRGFSSVVFSDYINKLTSSEVRATVLSVQSMFNRLVYALIIPIFGYIADVFTLTYTMFIIGASGLVVGSILLLILWKDRVI
ncbi:MFS transporter [Candidatus Woesearchaeota archaeon]|nr:MFS transporter [Candidatus Woesearchaeota archaeon]